MVKMLDKKSNLSILSSRYIKRTCLCFSALPRKISQGAQAETGNTEIQNPNQRKPNIMVTMSDGTTMTRDEYREWLARGGN